MFYPGFRIFGQAVQEIFAIYSAKSRVLAHIDAPSARNTAVPPGTNTQNPIPHSKSTRGGLKRIGPVVPSGEARQGTRRRADGKFDLDLP